MSNSSADLKPFLGILFVALTIAFTVTGQLLVKLGVNAISSQPHTGTSSLTTLFRALTNWQVVVGLACAVAAAFCWIVAVSKTSLSFAYPFMGLAIVLVLALTPLALKESISPKQWIGVFIVCFGLWVAAQK